MVHESQVVVLIAWFFVLVVVVARAFVPALNSLAGGVARATSTTSSGAHYAPTFKNSRSTRRERRNQLSTRIVV